MAFDAFLQFVKPSADAPPVEGEDQPPPMVSPSTAERQEDLLKAQALGSEKLPEASELGAEKLPGIEAKIPDATAARKP